MGVLIGATLSWKGKSVLQLAACSNLLPHHSHHQEIRAKDLGKLLVKYPDNLCFVLQDPFVRTQKGIRMQKPNAHDSRWFMIFFATCYLDASPELTQEVVPSSPHPKSCSLLASFVSSPSYLVSTHSNFSKTYPSSASKQALKSTPTAAPNFAKRHRQRGRHQKALPENRGKTLGKKMIVLFLF